MSHKTTASVAHTIGIDTGKNTLHLIGLDDKGPIVLREKIARGRIAARLANVPRLSLSETLSGWRLTENRAMLLFNEGSFQAHWLDGCRSIAVAGSARGRDLDIAAANKRFAADCS